MMMTCLTTMMIYEYEVVSSTDVLENDVDVEEHSFKIPQLDGKAESSEDDDDLSDNDDDLDSDSDLNTDEEDALDDVGIEMEDPCSADDISDEEASDLYDTDNVVVFQYE